jgi:hypothetical protein
VKKKKIARGSPFPKNCSGARRGPTHLALPLTAGAAGPTGLPGVFNSDDSSSLVVANVLSSPPHARLRFQAMSSSSSLPPSSSPESSPPTPSSSLDPLSPFLRLFLFSSIYWSNRPIYQQNRYRLIYFHSSKSPHRIMERFLSGFVEYRGYR